MSAAAAAAAAAGVVVVVVVVVVPYFSRKQGGCLCSSLYLSMFRVLDLMQDSGQHLASPYLLN